MALAAPQLDEDEYSYDGQRVTGEAPPRRPVQRNASPSSRRARAASTPVASTPPTPRRAVQRPTSSQRVRDHSDTTDVLSHHEARQRIARVRARRAHKPFRL